MAAENAIAFVVAVGDVMGAEPVGEHSLALRLNKGADFCNDGFVEFHLGVEVPALQIDAVEAGVAEGALECLLAAGVLVRRGKAAATRAAVLCIGCLKADGFTNGTGSGVGGPADVIFLSFIGGEIVEIMQVLAGGGAIALECFQGILLNLGIRVAKGERCQ